MSISVVAGVLTNNKEILLCKTTRDHKHFPSQWEFPGGKIEEGESLKDALQRELKEELSIIVEKHSMHVFNNNSRLFGNILLTLLIVDKWTGDIQINQQIHSEILFLDQMLLNTVTNMVTNDQCFIQSIQQHINTKSSNQSKNNDHQTN